MKSGGGPPPIQLVSDILRRYLTATYGTRPAIQIEAGSPFPHTRWSWIQRYTILRGGRITEYVIKIPRFPDQTSPALSWQSDELLRRGQQEYSTLVRLYNHFAAQDNPRLRALRPETYLPEINAVVMDFAPGRSLYESTVMIRPLLSPGGRKQALQRLNTVGQWLGWLHLLPTPTTVSEQTPKHPPSLDTLRHYAEHLTDYASGPQVIAGWASALDILRHATLDPPVWSHGDFHMGNILLLPEEAILSLDTALEALDDPCADIAKLIVDLRTRRWRLVSQGLLPPDSVIDPLIAAFLAGYRVSRGPANDLVLALYEGMYLLEKWLQCHTTVGDHAASGVTGWVTPLLNRNINQVLARMVESWVARVHRLATEQNVVGS